MIVEVAGARIVIAVPRALVPELHTHLVDLAAPSDVADAPRMLRLAPARDGALDLHDDEELVRTGIDPRVAVATLVWHLNAIAARSPDHLAVHAAVVGDRGAVLLPGRSGAGKSTLAHACVESGLSYGSDELALLDLAHGELHPYPKPIGLPAERLVPASALRAGAPSGSMGPCAIVFPEFRAGAPTAMTRLDPTWTLTALAAHSPNLAALGGAALPVLVAVATSVPAWQVTYGDTATGVGAVRDAAARPPATLRPLHVFPAVTATTVTVPVGDGLAVFDEVRGELHILDETAARVWRSVPQGTTAAELVEQISRTGELSRDDVAATVAHLARTGLLGEGTLR